MRLKAGGCLLAEHILEWLVVRWDHKLHLRLRAFHEDGTHIDLRFGNRGQTVLETGLAPVSDYLRIPSDFWITLSEQGASQDDIHSGPLQYQKLDSFLVQTSNSPHQRGRLIIYPSKLKQLFLNGLDSELPGLPPFGIG